MRAESSYKLAVGMALVVAIGACGESDSGPPDTGKRDANALDARVVDGRVVIDGRIVDGSVNQPDATSSSNRCTTHHDCEQEEFCHRGECRLDSQPVYHCGKFGCPPGHWCVEADGRRDRCDEDLRYSCRTACDCGPAHCCIDHDGDPSSPKTCIRDAGDPAFPGPASGTGATCQVGIGVPRDERDPTYCAGDQHCIVAMLAWESAERRRGTLLAISDPEGDGKGATLNGCGDAQCETTACDCNLGESCIDVRNVQDPFCFPAGTCVGHSVAESVFDWDARDLLFCCTDDCAPGERCEVPESMLNGTALEPIVATCMAESECECGDRVCCPGEITSCRSDCLPNHPVCGDGQCELFEDWENCNEDCPIGCGDAVCNNIAGEDETNCPTDCTEICGDHVCSVGESESSSCTTDCPQSCHPGGQLFMSPKQVPLPQYSVCGDGICTYRGNEGAGSSTQDKYNAGYLFRTEYCGNCPEDCGLCTD